MSKAKKVALLVRDAGNVWECVRSALGLAIQATEVGVFILNTPVELGERAEAFRENLEMIDELDGHIWSNNRETAGRFDFVEYLTIEEMAVRIREYGEMAAF